MKTKNDYISVWLFSIIVMIVIMVCLGGITRITGSGLSITEWKPIMGAIPPLNQSEWEEAFFKYKMIPQFQILNSTITLSDFKFLFFWEYFHRLVGRLIGLVVLVPGMIFIVRKQLNREFTRKIIIGFSLGAAQGFLGWFMVKSGLSELVYVSHLRLTAHLMLALSILSYWTFVYLTWKNKTTSTFKNNLAATQSLTSVYVLAILLVIQLSYGALVAGLKAGLSYNTFPKMNGEWIPSNLFPMDPQWLSLFSNAATTQFIHRWNAVVLVMVALLALYFSKVENLPLKTRKKGHYFMMFLFVQFVLGVLTLVYQVPLVIAALHQLNACMLVIGISVWLYDLKHEVINP